MSDFFIQPTTRVIPLRSMPDHWIEVKTELTYYEEKQLAGGSLRQIGTEADGTPQFRVDLAAFGIAQLSTWLVDWSFTRPNAQGKPEKVPLSVEAIKALRPEIGAEIEELLAEHIQELQAKKAPTTPRPTRPGA